MKKLRLHLRQYKNTVEMRVLEQDGIDKPLSSRIQVGTHPTLTNYYICLRGEDYIRDNDICCITFYTELEASAYLEKVIGWLDEVFYPCGDKEIKRGDTVIAKAYNEFSTYFITDLGEDVEYGRYVTAKCFKDGKYSDIGLWNAISKAKMSGHDKETNEYYGEIK